MSAIIYLKRHHRRGIYHYAKLWPDRDPPLCELINFMNTLPIIEQREYDLDVAHDRLEYKDLFDAWEWIQEGEFRQAYKQATASDFQLYINGKPI